MANRRMFSKAITNSEEFSVMPKSSQALYFHLGMEADDDGFIHPGQIMRAGGFQGDDLKILLAKRFLLAFESGVVVIKHWLIHNLIQKDRHLKTRYQDELKSLFIKDNKAYSDNDPTIPKSVNKVLTQVRLGKDSIGQDISNENVADTKESIQPLIELFKDVNPNYERLYANKTQRAALQRLVDKYGVEKVSNGIAKLVEVINQKYAPRITTPLQLEQKMGELIAFLNQQKPKINKIGIAI